MLNYNLSVSLSDVISIIKRHIPNESIYKEYPEGIIGYEMPTRKHYLILVNRITNMFEDWIWELSNREATGIEKPIDLNEFRKQFYSDENGMVNVGLYDVGQVYGGPEEGGWYYTQQHLAESKLMPYEEAIEYVKEIDKDNKGRYTYQGYQVAYIELAAGQHEKTHSQYYC